MVRQIFYARGARSGGVLLLEIKGDFPAVHEMLDYKNYKFEVLAIEERRISKVKVTVCGKDNE